MFIQITTEISAQVRDEINEIKTKFKSQSSDVAFDTYLYYAIKAWCNRLNIAQNINDYILQHYSQLNEIKELTKCIWQEGITEKQSLQTPVCEIPTSFFSVENKLYKYKNALFNRINIRSVNMNFLVLIAFVITAVGYWIYIINRQGQQQKIRREEPKQYNPKPPFPTIQAPPVQRTTKQFLVLVVSALQADFIGSLKDKRHIDLSDGEALYEITRYLWLGSENEYSQKIANVNQYSVFQGEESEYNVYLVSIELKQGDEGFKPNINQLDRYDAFRKLTDLAVDVRVSDRLRIESYEKFEVYNR